MSSTLVGDLELPAFDLSDPSLTGASYHHELASLREQGWLARSPLAVVVLDRAAGDFFLRARGAAFPGRQLAALFGITSGPLYDHIDANILNLSDAHHRRLRSLVNRAFTPVAADRWRPTMRALLDQLWEARDEPDRCEFVATFAKPYPALTIAAVLGAPAADAPRLHEWSSWVQRQFDVRAMSTELPRIESAVVEVNEYVEALLASDDARSGSSLVASLLEAEEDGDRLSHTECVNLIVNVLAGAIDTTQSELSHAMHLFATHPEQWAALRASPELASAAVAEVLRVEPVAPFTARLCLEELEYDGVRFPEGTIVAICAERANRELDDGESFDITATRDARALTFGSGPHFCLGANLARAELEEALGFLAPRMAELAVAGPPCFGAIDGIYGVDALPLRWTSEDAG
jgi:cytochrome P450